jgi:hypothetical protein
MPLNHSASASAHAMPNAEGQLTRRQRLSAAGEFLSR